LSLSRQLKTALVLILCIFLPHLSINAQQTSELLQEANQLYENAEEQKALSVYKEVLQQEPNNFKATWRASLLYSGVGSRLEDEEKKKNYYFNAMKLAEQAVHIDSANATSQYVLSVALGRRAEMANAKQRVASTRKIERVTDRGLSIDPNHAGLLHVKGYLYYKIATASTLETMAANMLFGGFPEDVTLEKSIDLLQQAVKNRPDYIRYLYDLAMAYKQNGDLTKAKSLLESIRNKPEQTPDDSTIKQHARKELTTL